MPVDQGKRQREQVGQDHAQQRVPGIDRQNGGREINGDARRKRSRPARGSNHQQRDRRDYAKEDNEINCSIAARLLCATTGPLLEARRRFSPLKLVPLAGIFGNEYLSHRVPPYNVSGSMEVLFLSGAMPASTREWDGAGRNSPPAACQKCQFRMCVSLFRVGAHAISPPFFSILYISLATLEAIVVRLRKSKEKQLLARHFRRHGCRADSRADPDSLDIDEFADAERGEFAPVAAAFDAAEGQARVGCRHAVDEDAAAFDAPRELATAFDVARPQVAAETKLRVVCQFDGVVGVAGANDGCCRAEGLFTEHRHLRRDARDDSRL